MYIYTHTYIFLSNNHVENPPKYSKVNSKKNTYGWSIYAEFSGQQKESFSQHVDIHLLKDEKPLFKS